MENEERRKDDLRKDDQDFKFKVIEQHGQIQALLSSSNARIEGLADDIKGHTVAIAEIRYAMWGGPRESDVGLLEKHRKLARNWTIAVAVSAFVFSALGKIVQPLYSKLVIDKLYNSPSEKWMREQSRPSIKHYKIELKE